MDIAFAYVTDERGFELAIHSAASVALSQVPPCSIHIFCHRFEPAHASQLQAALAKVGAHLMFHDIHDESVEQFDTRGHVTKTALLKLPAIERIMDGHDRIAYLDNDILVFDNLPIAAIDFGSAPMAAVLDMDVSNSGAYRDVRWGRLDRQSSATWSYFNSGFMIFACEALAAGRYPQSYREALERHRTGCSIKLACTSADQCPLNIAFENRWLPLPLSYNLQAGAKFTSAWRNATVRHYCGPRKFLPISWFRNDARDICLLNRIGSLIDRPAIKTSGLYEVLFRLNAIRRFKADFPIRRLIRTVEMTGGAAAS